MYSILVIYVILNVYGFLLMYIDKNRAKNNKWRISEKHIWIVSMVGGALGTTFGMKQFRHKTKHKQFVILLPVLTILTIAIYVYILVTLS
ncbi:DUF1294 domain-containing protein [Bacillus timonensis]|uniref:DUF1294 domain-containing protein n=1 Tax=Bacillus timonensis TaxID=1033734 RepID=A0A4S3PYM8_9BACI|nr:DUF1294 domain-containing protein [Bacillus timonensis]THE14715.1 DUF1294 domain-containing protein [Bacillus timonensis]